MKNNLNYILKQKGIKKNWLARQLKVSNQTITNWAKGYNYPNLKKVKKVSRILNIKEGEIFFIKDNNANIDNLNTDIDNKS